MAGDEGRRLRARGEPAPLRWGSRLFAVGLLALAGRLALPAGGTPTVSAAQEGWTSAGAMQVARSNHTATLLSCPGTAEPLPAHCGKVLMAGGDQVDPQGNDTVLSSAELFDPLTGRSTPTRDMPEPRTYHTATKLRDGRVLIAGGLTSPGYRCPADHAMIYDPLIDAWKTLDGPRQSPTARVSHVAVTLPDGRVLVAGGFGRDTRPGQDPCEVSNGFGLTSTQLFSPDTNTWQNAGDMGQGRGNFAAALVQSSVLAIGGYPGSGINEGSAAVDNESFDPRGGARGAWHPAPDSVLSRDDHTVTTLSDGRLLVAGGVQRPKGIPTSTAEIRSPDGTWVPTGSMALPRFSHTATLLADGRVLVVGGLTATPGIVPLAEVFDPATGIWTLAGVPRTARQNHVALALGNQPCAVNAGRVLVAGGEGPYSPSDPSAAASQSSIEVFPAPLVQGCPPLVASALPARLTQGVRGSVVVTGARFAAGASIAFGPGVQVMSSSVRSPTSLGAVLAVDIGAHIGPRDITVTNPDGLSGTCSGCFTVDRINGVQPPQLSQLSPSWGPAAGGTTVTISGSGLGGASMVSFGSDHPVRSHPCGSPAPSATPCFSADPSGGIITTLNPALPGGGTVSVSVSVPGAGTSNALPYRYLADRAALAVDEQLRNSAARLRAHRLDGSAQRRGAAAATTALAGTPPGGSSLPPPLTAGGSPVGVVVPAPLSASPSMAGLPAPRSQRAAPQQVLSMVLPDPGLVWPGALLLAYAACLMGRNRPRTRPVPAPRRA